MASTTSWQGGSCYTTAERTKLVARLSDAGVQSISGSWFHYTKWKNTGEEATAKLRALLDSDGSDEEVVSGECN